MRKLNLKSAVIGTMLAACLPVMADDCVMHVRTVNGETLDVAITEPTDPSWGGSTAVASLYGSANEAPGYIFFTSQGKIKYENGCPVPAVEDGVTKGAILCEIPLINIAEINFTKPSGVKNVTSDSVGVHIAEGIMSISRVAEPVRVTIASISGAVEYDRVIDSDTEIDLNRFGSGVHTIAAGNLTFKILVK